MSTLPTAVVTGSSSGIGRAVACELARAGYAVVLHGCSNYRGAQATAHAILDKQPQAQLRCLMADFRCPSARGDFVQAAFAWHERVDAWINLAGADILTKSLRSSSYDEKLRALFDIDVVATIDLCRRAAARMQRHAVLATHAPTPSIINVGWDQAELGMEGEAGQLFCPSKAAVMAFSRALAMTVAPQIRVNCVAPGWIQTDWGRQHASPAWEQRATSEALLARWGKPEDVAAAIRWLVSPEAAFVNAQTISVNGGRRFYPMP